MAIYNHHGPSRQWQLQAVLWYLCFFASQVSVQPFLGAWFAKKGLSAQDLGLMSALTPWISLPSSTLWGALADHLLLHRCVMLSCLVASGLTRCALLGVDGFPAILALVLVTQILSSPVAVLADAAVVAACRDNEYGAYRKWGAVGWGVMSTVAGAVIDEWGMAAAVALHLGLTLPCLWFGWALHDHQAGQLRLARASAAAAASLRARYKRVNVLEPVKEEDESDDEDEEAGELESANWAARSNAGDEHRHTNGGGVGSGAGGGVAAGAGSGTGDGAGVSGAGGAGSDIQGLASDLVLSIHESHADHGKHQSPTGNQEAIGIDMGPGQSSNVAQYQGRQEQLLQRGLQEQPQQHQHQLKASGQVEAPGPPEVQAETAQGLQQRLLPRDDNSSGGGGDSNAGGKENGDSGGEGKGRRRSWGAGSGGGAAPGDGARGGNGDALHLASAAPTAFRDKMRALMADRQIVLFLLMTTLLGFGYGTIETFLFVFLQQLGASDLLMGLTLTVTCIAEVPVFQAQQWLMNKCGVDRLLDLVVAVYALRMVCYATLPAWGTAWAVLPVEALHGVTFGLGWGVGTTNSKRLAPPGLAATMQGLFQGCYFGLGYGIGSLLGGVVSQQHGFPAMYLLGAVCMGVGWACLTVGKLWVEISQGRWFQWLRGAHSGAAASARPGSPTGPATSAVALARVGAGATSYRRLDA